jgi:hypothetical protein
MVVTQGGQQHVNDDFATITYFELEADEQDDDRSQYTPVEERALRLLGRENRVGVAVQTPRPTKTGEPGQAAYDIGLMLVVHAHPECRFVWSRLVVDLSSTPGAIVEDMSPAEIENHAVEVETRVGAGLKFTTVLKAVDIELKPELARKRTVHFPTVTASGTGFRKAYWDFMANGDNYLHANRELRLLVSAPAGAPVVASVAVRARLRLPGLRSLVPVRKRAGLESTVELVSEAVAAASVH